MKQVVWLPINFVSKSDSSSIFEISEGLQSFSLHTYKFKTFKLSHKILKTWNLLGVLCILITLLKVQDLWSLYLRCTDPVLVHFQEKCWNHTLVLVILERGPSKLLDGVEMFNVKSFNQTLLPRFLAPIEAQGVRPVQTCLDIAWWANELRLWFLEFSKLENNTQHKVIKLNIAGFSHWRLV